jgi:hypothetical protein
MKVFGKLRNLLAQNVWKMHRWRKIGGILKGKCMGALEKWLKKGKLPLKSKN